MDVLVTGANGTIGSALRSHFPDEFDLTRLDVAGGDGTIVGDVADYESIRPAFEGRDAVVHLAVHPLSDDNWSDVLETNVVGTYNVLEAARDAEVPRFVFASSNHAVGLYERENAPEIYYGEVELTLDETTAPRPDSFYGTSKAFGEALTCFYANRFQYPVRAQSIRVCSVRDSNCDHPYAIAERGVAEDRWERESAAYDLHVARQKAMWQSRRDCAQLFRRCLETDAPGHHVFYGVSDNERRWVDIGHANDVLGYEPADSADDWTSPPTTQRNAE